MFSNKRKTEQVLLAFSVAVILLLSNKLWGQDAFFPRGVYSVMNSNYHHLDSLDQVQRAGFNVIHAGKHIKPYDRAILDSGAHYGMMVSFDGGVYVHNYLSAQYNIYEAELEQGDVPDPAHPDWFYWYEHDTGREYADVAAPGWYANDKEHNAGYLMHGVYDAGDKSSNGLWHEQIISPEGTEFEAAYRLRMGSSGVMAPQSPVVNLEVQVWLEDGASPGHFNTLVDSTLVVKNFTEGIWDTFRVYYRLSRPGSEKFVHHNLYWHGLKEIWVDRVEVKDVAYGVPLFNHSVDNEIRCAVDNAGGIARANDPFWRWYLWNEPRRIQFRARMYVYQLLNQEPILYFSELLPMEEKQPGSLVDPGQLEPVWDFNSLILKLPNQATNTNVTRLQNQPACWRDKF